MPDGLLPGFPRSGIRARGLFHPVRLEGGQQTLANNEMIDAYSDFYITKDKEHRSGGASIASLNSPPTPTSPSTNRQEMTGMNRYRAARWGKRFVCGLLLSPKVACKSADLAQLAAYHNGPGDYGVFGIMVYNGQSRADWS
ncbi:MAG: hypothetical protein MRJ92_10440 [Nitrospira sp.]|nr:hypothetical protein [Nitrospira sp.]